MQKSEYRHIFENENSHFFYVANHKLIVSLVQKYLGNRQNLKILDAGCGTGLLAQKLTQFGKVWAIDSSLDAIKFAKKRRVNAQVASITKLPFKNSTFDLIVCIDVIYHKWIKDDIQALAELARVLKPRGLLIIRVPAHQFLNKSTDKYVFTRQRYAKDELVHKLKKPNLLVKKISYINLILLPPAIMALFFEKITKPKRPTSPLISLPKPINKLITFVLFAENYFLLSEDLPLGLGIIAVAQKMAKKS